MRQLTLLLACFAAAAFGQHPPGNATVAATRYVIDRFRFSVEVPSGWRTATGPDEGLPLFTNLPWSRIQGRPALPKGAATIHMLSEEDLPAPVAHYTLEGWAEFGQRGSVRGTATSGLFEMPPSTDVSKAIVAAFDEQTFGPSVPVQHTVAVYWEFRGHRFATYLIYAVGDPKGKRYEGVLTAVMRSIRPL